MSSDFIYSSTDPRFLFLLAGLLQVPFISLPAPRPAQQFNLHLQPYSHLDQLATTEVTRRNDNKRTSKNCWL